MLLFDNWDVNIMNFYMLDSTPKSSSSLVNHRHMIIYSEFLCPLNQSSSFVSGQSIFALFRQLNHSILIWSITNLVFRRQISWFTCIMNQYRALTDIVCQENYSINNYWNLFIINDYSIIIW